MIFDLSISFGRLVVLGIRHSRQAVPFVEPPSQVDIPTAFAAKRHCYGLFGIELAFTNDTLHGMSAR
jgi:hypothetical protein